MFHLYRNQQSGKSLSKSKSCIIVTFVFVIIFFMISIIYTKNANMRIYILHIDVKSKIEQNTENDKFLSFGLDSVMIFNHFKGFNMTNPKLLKLVEGLSPAYLRIGGNMADRLTFTPNKQFQVDEDFPNFTMNGLQWLELNKFAENTGMDIIFDLNALKRFDNGSWDYHNAQELIEFSNSNKLQLFWELANEPNSFKHKFNYEVNATQLSADFQLLRTILDKYELYKNSKLIGPSTTRPQVDHKESQRFLEDFLRAGGGKALDAITWHHYYFNGRTVKSEQFLDPLEFDILKWQIAVVQIITQHLNLQDKPIWIGETASAYGGGAPGLSDRFISTFIWLDKLGITSKMGIQCVVRQTIFNQNYALIDNSYNPNPNYWISLLYKRLVDVKLVNCISTTNNRVRLYCHCAKRNNNTNTSSIIIYGMNINSFVVNIRIDGDIPLSQESKLKIYSYSLTTLKTLTSKNVYLNGELLKLTETNDIPVLKPKFIPTYPYIKMLPYSIVFWIVPINTTIC